MFDSVINFFEKLVTDFTWTRFSFVVVLLLLALGGVVIFETYTNHFALNRLEREVDILSKLTTASEGIELENRTENIGQAYDLLIAQFKARFQERGISIGALPPWSSKAVYALLPWLALTLLLALTSKEGRRSALLGVTIIAIPFVIGGIVLPEFQASWVNRWVYPWGSMVLVVAVIMAFQRR